MIKNKYCHILLVAIVVITLFFQSRELSAQSTTRLTFYTGTDTIPAWDPRGSVIAYVRSKVVGGSVFDAYRVLSDGTGGEQAYLLGSNTDFGVATNLCWMDTSGFLGVEEAISGFEVLKFNTAAAPFTRTAPNGGDTNNTLLLSINGGGGGGIFKVSRDQSTALIRLSTSGSGGTISIRAGPVSSLAGQVSSSFGTTLVSVNALSDPLFYNGAALSPDGSKYLLSYPISTSGTPHDLILGNTDGTGSTVNLTNTASSGFYNVFPEYSPDGTKIIFSRKSSSASDTYDLYMMNSDGSNLTQLTNTPNFSETNASWSPDGSSVAFAGLHTAGHESETPALEDAESANVNIYKLVLPTPTSTPTLTPTATATVTPTIPATPTPGIVTPKTKLLDPPEIEIVLRRITFVFLKFLRADLPKKGKKLIFSDLESPQIFEASKGPKPKITYQYDLVVTKGVGKKQDTIRKTSKKNTITLSNLKPGNYSAKYRVTIMKKAGSKTSVAGQTRFSPPIKFSIE